MWLGGNCTKPSVGRLGDNKTRSLLGKIRAQESHSRASGNMDGSVVDSRSIFTELFTDDLTDNQKFDSYLQKCGKDSRSRKCNTGNRKCNTGGLKIVMSDPVRKSPAPCRQGSHKLAHVKVQWGDSYLPTQALVRNIGERLRPGSNEWTSGHVVNIPSRGHTSVTPYGGRQWRCSSEQSQRSMHFQNVLVIGKRMTICPDQLIK